MCQIAVNLVVHCYFFVGFFVGIKMESLTEFLDKFNNLY